MLNSYRSGARLIPQMSETEMTSMTDQGEPAVGYKLEVDILCPWASIWVYIGHHVDQMGAYGHKMSTSVTNEPVEI